MTCSTRGEELLLLLLMLLYLLLCSDSRHAKRAENVNAIDRKSSEFVAGKLGKKDMISAFQRTTLSLHARKWTRTSSKSSKRKSKRDVIVSFAKRRSFGERNEDVNDIKEEEEFAGERTTTTVSTLRHALMTTLAILALSDTLDANAAQVVDWLTSGAEASPEELMRIMRESSKQDWDPTEVAPRVKVDEGDEVWEKNVNANMLGESIRKEDLSSDGYDIDAPIMSSDTFGRLGKFGVILVGADFVTAFVMGKSVLGVAKGLEKGEGDEKKDWKENAAEMVMDKLKAKAEVLKEEEGRGEGEGDEEES
jgi:hypothetical protein|tara:strand:+ start:765 stop:1688 length:924 start_codon:yes stop_codon:yes gene_type:complete